MTQITLIGYGNQGRAWAHNLRDSGWKVFVSGRDERFGGKGMTQAKSDGFSVVAPELLSTQSGLIAFLLPDEAIPLFYKEYFVKSAALIFTEAQRRSFIFAHGFSVVYGGMDFSQHDDVILVAPKGIGVKLRENYAAGSGVMGVLGVKQNASGEAWEKASAIATGLGCARVGILKSSFEEETITDLFSEQVILCGSVPRLVEESVRFLVNKGIDPKLATYECLHELKLIVDMMVAKGIAGMYRDVSTTAKLGGLRAAEHFLPREELKEKMESLWQEIQSGFFAKELKKDLENNFAGLKKNLAEFQDSPVDKNL